MVSDLYNIILSWKCKTQSGNIMKCFPHYLTNQSMAKPNTGWLDERVFSW